MKPRRGGYNPKRRIAPAERLDPQQLKKLAAAANYGGNPEHKLHLGDYGLSPPQNPRPGKTLCDAEREINKAEAQALLEEGLRRGLVSEQLRSEWPQNVWAVAEGDVVFEAQLENQAAGVYHGYPLPQADDFREQVLEEWRRRGS